MKRIPVAGPWITQKEKAYVADAAANAWYERAGEYHERFEAAFARYAGVEHAMALPSCTSALHLALLALGVGPGDEVIVPDITWIATSAPVDYVGATVVFADIDPATWCLSPASVEACLTPRTRAVVPVDLYGSLPDFDGLRALARSRDFAIIEDAAEAVGAIYHGARAGSLGDVGVFSFHGSKTLTTGEGGMLLTRRADLARRAATLRDHGRAPGDVMFWNAEVAHKYKMSALQAALGLAQLERVEELVAKKREAFGWYREELARVEGVQWNPEPAGTSSSFWMTTAVVDPERGVSKERLAARFDEAGIDTRPFFHPLSSLPAYAARPEASRARERNANAYRLSASGINLPSSAALTRDDVSRVARTFRAALAE
jgi:perosamine synthetase